MVDREPVEIMCENSTKGVESDNTSSDNVLKLPHNSGREGQARAHSKGLRRRDLTSAFIARFHANYKHGGGCWEWQTGRLELIPDGRRRKAA